MPCVIAIDAGTTGVRAMAVDVGGNIVDWAYRELTQHFPRPGWVEHDPQEIWRHVASTVSEVAARQHQQGSAVCAIGITNQRETVVAWDRRRGQPLHRALVWQDRRTARRCRELVEAGHLPQVRETTGLLLDPYFSATKIGWLVQQGEVAPRPDVVFGTVDSWLLWNLTGGASASRKGPGGAGSGTSTGGGHDGVVATDITNASRTLLFDLQRRTWSAELCDLFGVPLANLPEVRPSCGRIGTIGGDLASAEGLAGVPVSGIAGDQQAALFGQACFTPGMAKVTYGTGSFVLLNVGEHCPEPVDGLITTVAWDLGDHASTPGAVAYALEGSVFSTGAAIQWLRDGIGIIDRAEEMGPLAGSVDDSGGVVVVPAFTGMGSPWWDPSARAAITGLTRGTNRAHLARAVVEAITFQVRDVVEAMTAGGAGATVLRADGGASVMDLLLQLQADQLRIPVARPVVTETTALGAASLAGLAEGVWGSVDQLAGLWKLHVERHPSGPREVADAHHGRWLQAVARAGGWAIDRGLITPRTAAGA